MKNKGLEKWKRKLLTNKKMILSILRIIEEYDFKDFYELDEYIYRNCKLPVIRVFRKNYEYFNNVVIGKYLHEKRLRKSQGGIKHE